MIPKTDADMLRSNMNAFRKLLRSLTSETDQVKLVERVHLLDELVSHEIMRVIDSTDHMS